MKVRRGRTTRDRRQQKLVKDLHCVEYTPSRLKIVNICRFVSYKQKGSLKQLLISLFEADPLQNRLVRRSSIPVKMPMEVVLTLLVEMKLIGSSYFKKQMSSLRDCQIV